MHELMKYIIEHNRSAVAVHDKNLTNAMPIHDDRGNLMGYRGSDQEVTKLKEVKEQMYKSLQSGVASMALVHELVYESSNFAEIEAGELIRRLANYLDTIYEPEEKISPCSSGRMTSCSP